ncbi:MAG: hypothetical protein AAF585_08705, partial [Verrucomicrobiota bacterium]
MKQHTKSLPVEENGAIAFSFAKRLGLLLFAFCFIFGGVSMAQDEDQSVEELLRILGLSRKHLNQPGGEGDGLPTQAPEGANAPVEGEPANPDPAL